MKRVMSRSLFLIAATHICRRRLLPFAPSAQRAATSRAPPVSRSETEPASSQGPQKASGIVPPGVKLAPEMPAPGAPRPFEFPKAAIEDPAQRSARFRRHRPSRAGRRRAPGDSFRRQHSGPRGNAGSRGNDGWPADAGNREALRQGNCRSD